ncbi:MAG TPA: TIGR03619 family F420-dependent LLM class oxidoreductase [Chloroflexota bacterium]|nr:TIGR03619 family F420-dependent LLM class oxidoreductase [Chloroflexota bacterium]
MKVGVNLINFGAATTPEVLLGWAHMAQEAGYDAVMLSDHVVGTPDVAARYAHFYDPLATLAFLAGVTQGIELGTTVLVLPYRHPLLVARLGANIDQLSGGRFILGVGVGHSKPEFAALNVPFTKRGAITDESLDLIRQMWTKDRVSFEGRFFSVADADTSPRPVRRPHPPIWIGGRSEAAMRRAVRFGTHWHPNWIRLPWLRDEGWPRLQELARELGMPVPGLAPRIFTGLTETANTDSVRLAGHGTLDQIRADVRAIEDLGAEYLILDVYGPPRSYDPANPAYEEDWAKLRMLAQKVFGRS